MFARQLTRARGGWLKAIAVIPLLAVTLSVSVADELAEGTEINAQNWEQMKNHSFEGKTILSMVPESIQQAVTVNNLRITLRHSESMPYDQRILDATAKYSDQVKYDPDSRMVSGYVAGIPFPDHDAIEAAAPEQAGDMLMYNVFFASVVNGDYTNCYGPYATIQIDGEKGVERAQGGYALLYRAQGRTTGGPTQIGDDPTLRKTQVIMFDSPYDISGLGIYRKVFNDGKVDELYAYVKSVRRIRRISGGSWMDTLAGTDILNDDTYSFEAHPVWYPKITLKEKRWILWPVHSDPVVAHDLIDVLDYKNPPYWNPINRNWEPREVYVVEITTPDSHPYSKKVVYVNRELPAALFTEAYTRAGEFWKIIYSMLAPWHEYDESNGGPPAYVLANFGAWDVRSRHGNYMDCGRYDVNDEVKPGSIHPRMMKRSADGKRTGNHTDFGEGL